MQNKNVPWIFQRHFLVSNFLTSVISRHYFNNAKVVDILDICGLHLNGVLTWCVIHCDTSKNMRDTPGQQLSIYCIFQQLTHPSLTGHFQFKVRNYGIVYPLTLETALLSIDSKAH